MVVIRLARRGSKKNPFYHIVAADKRRARDSRFIERLGYYNPMARGQDIRLKMEKERIDYWLGQGAKASLRVNSLIKQFTQSPEEAQKGGMSRNEAKKIQAEQTAKAQKKAAAAAKKAEEAAAKAKPAEEPKAEEKPAKEAKAEEKPADDKKEGA